MRLGMTHDEYVKRVKELHPNVQVLDEYKGRHKKILHKCIIDGYEWKPEPNNILHGSGCPKCKKCYRYTHEEYINKVSKINPNIEVIGIYVGSHKKILHRCKIDGYEWMVRPHDIIQGYGCPMCSGNVHITHQQYVDKVNLINPNIEVVGKYTRNDINIAHRCKICGYEWTAKPRDIIFNKSGCPVCAHKVVTEQNCLATARPDLLHYFVNKNDAYTHMPYSHNKVDLKCPLCGAINSIQICNLTMHGFSCVCCGDGVSFPEKYMHNLLNQLGVEFVHHKIFEWSNHVFMPWCKKYGRKQYDFWLPDYNIIIETHGIQHYNEKNSRGRTFYEERQNDALKEQIAKENGYNIIIIDCRYSESEYIKNNILSSCLSQYFDFDKIDWSVINEQTQNNSLIKDVVDIWNQGKSIKEIMLLLNFSHSTIIKYLKKGVEIGWCHYSPEEAIIRRGKYYSSKCSTQQINLK